jgi:hypothetical protein
LRNGSFINRMVNAGLRNGSFINRMVNVH